MAYARLLPSVLRKRTCEGKRTYPSRSAAKDAARAIKRKQPGTNLQEYRCPFCSDIHLGNKPELIHYGNGTRTIPC
jgi:hypothetical protein